MLGVDRLDFIKGLPQKLLAFEKFLKKNPHMQVRKVVGFVPTVCMLAADSTQTSFPHFRGSSERARLPKIVLGGRDGALSC